MTARASAPVDVGPVDAGDSPASPADELRQWQENLRQGVALLADNRQGRSLLRWLLTSCHCFEASDPGPQDAPGSLYAREGRRVLGLRLLRLVQETRPARVAQLLTPEEHDV